MARLGGGESEGLWNKFVVDDVELTGAEVKFMSTKEDFVLSNRRSWDEVVHRFFDRTALPTYGPFTPDERQLNLFGDVSGKRVLEIGCGSGHSLAYMASRGVLELWGLDLSETQIQTAGTTLKSYGTMDIHLFQTPMEQDPGLPRMIDKPKATNNVWVKENR
jgi:SAM-dependent methyltransferase